MKLSAKGNNVVEYDSWREMADADSWSEIDPSPLPPEQTEYLIAEFRKLVPIALEKDGHVLALRPQNPNQVSDPYIRFAIINLPLLNQSDVDSLFGCEYAALEYLNGIFGDLDLIDRAFVSRVSGKWKTVQMPQVGQESVECYRLADLYTLGLEDHFTGIWHAVRVLVHIQYARDAVKRGDAKAALESGLIVGKSHRALGVKLAVMTSGGGGGATSKDTGMQHVEDIAERNAWLRDEADKLRKITAYKDSEDALAKELEKRLKREAEKKVGWRTVGIRQIKTILRNI